MNETMINEAMMNETTEQRARRYRPKRRILRIKKGDNPNSSSVGTDIPAFFLAALGTGAMGILIMQIMDIYDRHVRKTHGEQGDN